MFERYDAVIVGGRVAGATLAAHIAQRGYSALVLERAAFPSDTLSTHLFQNLPALERLGVLDRLLATGAPVLDDWRINVDGIDLSQRHEGLAMLNVRRRVLDPILLARATELGAEAATARVTGLLRDGNRVTGVRFVDQERTEHEVRARVVVGADGRTSTVARLVGARRYNVTAGARCGGSAYYEGVDAPAAFQFHVRGSDVFIGAPGDHGLFLAIALWDQDEFPRYGAPGGEGFEASLATCPPLAGLLAGSHRTRPPILIKRWQGYFRESAGPGWALVGDAGHFKDPTPGQGISDALRQSESLAKAICRGLETHQMEPHLRHWAAWRDRDAAQMYWWAREMGRAGAPPTLVMEMFRRMAARPKTTRALHEVIDHTRQPWSLFNPPRAIAAAGRLLVNGKAPRRTVLKELNELAGRDFHRRWRTWRPEYEAPPAS